MSEDKQGTTTVVVSPSPFERNPRDAAERIRRELQVAKEHLEEAINLDRDDKVRADFASLAEAPMADAVHTTAVVRWGWRDRIKILLLGTSMTQVVVETEHVVGRTSTTARSWTPPVVARRERGAELLESERDDGVAGDGA